MEFRSVFGSHEYVVRKFEAEDEQLESFAFPGALRDRWVEGVSLVVEPRKRSAWAGHFLAGRESPNGASFSCDLAEDQRILVVARGTAFSVNVNDPENWSELSLRPVLTICVSNTAKAIVLVGYTSLLVLAPGGKLWSSPELSYDGLFEVREVDGKILGQGWDAASSTRVDFVVDLSSRSSTGGAAPQRR